MEAARIQRSIKLGPAPSPWHNPTEVLLAEALGVNHITICEDIIHFLLPNSSFLGWGAGSGSVLCWASQVVQLVKNLPAMQETLVSFLSQEVPLEKG